MSTMQIPAAPYGGTVSFSPSPAPPPPPPKPVVCGLYTTNKATDGWQDDSASGQQALTGVVPGIIHRFMPWSLTAPAGGPWGAWDSAWADDAHSQGCLPMITWEGRDLSNPSPAQGAYSDAAVVAGVWDATLTAWAQQAGAWGKPFLLRVRHECNGNGWFPWEVNVNGNTPGTGIDAYRHLWRLVKAHAPNALVMPNYGVKGTGWIPMEDCNPGVQYMDAISVDWYCEAPGDTAGYQDLGAIAPVIDRLAAMAPGKPIIIAETGCRVVAGQDTAGWYSRIPAYLAGEPRIRAVVFFDNVDGAYDFRVSSDPTIYAAYKAMIATPEMRGRWG